MRRLAFTWLVALAAPFAIVPAAVRAQVPMAAPRSATVVATTDPAANRRALQAALDALPSGGEVVVDGLPAASGSLAPGDFPIDRTVFLDRRGLGLRGTRGTRLLSVFPYAPDILSTIPRRPGGVALTPAHFEDASAALDATAGRRWAWKTLGDTHLAALGTDLDQAKGSWGGIDQLTLDFCYRDDHVGRWYAEAGLLFGFPARRPFTFYQMPDGRVMPVFVTADGVQRSFKLPVPHDNLPHRITVEIDLRAGTVRGGCDGRWVALQDVQLGKNWGPGLKLARNESGPFMVAANAAGATNVSDLYGGEFALTVFGLRVGANAIDYAPGAPGGAIARIDGRPLNDSGRYFNEPQSPSTLAWLPLDEPPDVVGADRLLCVMMQAGGKRRTYGYILDNKAHGSIANCALGGLTVSDLWLQGYGYGFGVAVGNVMHSRFERVRTAGLHTGFGTYNFGANYQNTLRDCELAGWDHPLRLGLSSGYFITNLAIYGSGRAPIRLALSGVRFDKVWSDGQRNGSAEAFAYLDGGSTTFERVEMDNEGGDWPSVGMFVADSTANVQTGWTMGLTVREFASGILPPGVPVFLLRGDPTARLIADSAGYDGVPRPVASVAGKGWVGTINLWGQKPSPSGDLLALPGGDASGIAILGRPTPIPAPTPAPTAPTAPTAAAK